MQRFRTSLGPSMSLASNGHSTSFNRRQSKYEQE